MSSAAERLGRGWSERADAPPGDGFSKRLILALSNGEFAFGDALLQDGYVHSWFWDDEKGRSCHEGVHAPTKVIAWRYAPSAQTIALKGVWDD